MLKSQNVFLAGLPPSVGGVRMTEMVHEPHHIDFGGFDWLRLTIKLDISLIAQFCILMRNPGHIVYMTFHDLVIVKVTGGGHDLDCLRSNVKFTEIVLTVCYIQK